MKLDENGLPDHFLMGPSSAYRWLRCSGSLNHVEDDGGGEAARIGSLCHAIAESQLKKRPLGQDDQRYFDGFTKQLQNELLEAVELCVEFVNSLPMKEKRYETKIPSAFIEEHGGTSDVIATNGVDLHVVDFKFGRGIVEIEDNDQVSCYLNLARQLYPSAKRFFGTIIQPFNGGIKGPIEFSAEHLDEIEKKVIRASITREYVGGDHCTFCPIIARCKAAGKFVQDQVSDFPDLTKLAAETGSRPSDADVELVAKLYKTYKIAEAGAEGAATILKAWGRRGVNIQQHGLGLRYSTRHEWNENAEGALAAAKVDPEDRGEFKLFTPTQLRQRLGITKESFEADFRGALNVREVETLVLGKGGKSDFSEFPDLS